jgi:hypothetical protein
VFDPVAVAQAAPPAQAIPWGTVTLWVLGALGTVGLAVGGIAKAVWSKMKEDQEKLVNAHLARAVSAETRATKAEERSQEAKQQYDRLKGEFKATTRALRLARRQEEVAIVGHTVSTPPPADSEEEHTGNYFVESAADRAWFEEREREKEHRRLNPDQFAREERARIEDLERRGRRAEPLLRRYLTPEHGVPRKPRGD